ncbi:hypothetical protein PAESOLCIP111_00945 [Paenibacillus solanacearum]|uniref:Uncharacterized protein n=1 Tax=Paenibacillus solanacearum TaxID=2048548 RepID=A0A916NH45_9BACL|nr:DUF6220 domain-containing protein [Paenibacillus solanacearum]CAG7607312.1 hypothetical protein PAESOLCIP111_00945 [Paenibacillus solanacearum]
MNDDSPERLHGDVVVTGQSRRIRSVRIVYAWLAAIYCLCVIVQVFLAGMGLFVSSNSWQWHRTFANSFELVSVVMFALSFAGRIRGVLRWFPLGLFALTVLQHMTLQLFSGVLPALHTVNALLLFWMSLVLMKNTLKWTVNSK